MKSFLSRNILAVVIGGVLIVGAAWYVFSGEEKSDSLLTTETGPGAENPAERGIVETLLTLRAVSLSGIIFSDPTFRVLKDFGTQIIPEPVGRENPFAPRESGSSAAGGKKLP